MHVDRVRRGRLELFGRHHVAQTAAVGHLPAVALVQHETVPAATVPPDGQGADTRRHQQPFGIERVAGRGP